MSNKIYKTRYEILFIIYLLGKNISYHLRYYYIYYDILYEIFTVAAFHKRPDIVNIYNI